MSCLEGKKLKKAIFGQIFNLFYLFIYFIFYFLFFIFFLFKILDSKGYFQSHNFQN